MTTVQVSACRLAIRNTIQRLAWIAAENLKTCTVWPEIREQTLQVVMFSGIVEIKSFQADMIGKAIQKPVGSITDLVCKI
jgi:hypothetical protein